MKRWEIWFLHVSNLLVGGTGLVYAWMRYAMAPADEWAVVNHPWQPHVQHLHLLVAPLLVFGAGLIWRQHVARQWRSGTPRRRRSGVGVIVGLVPMIVSGYLIQAAVEPAWRTVWVGMHLAASALWLVAYLAHQLSPRTREARAGEGVPSPLLGAAVMAKGGANEEAEELTS